MPICPICGVEDDDLEAHLWMHKIQVGQPYSLRRSSWPETPQYNYRAGGHDLRLFYSRPRPPEIASVQEGEARFALAIYRDVIFLCYRFGEHIPWSDCTYSWHLVDEAGRTLPPDWTEPEARALLTTVLVDADTGIVKALRVTSFSPSFTRQLHDAIRKQANRPWPGSEEYDRQWAHIYNAYTSSQIATKLALVRCKGGD